MTKELSGHRGRRRDRLAPSALGDLAGAEENATGATYTVKLSHVPTVTVTVGIGGHTGTDLTLSVPIDDTLTFNSSNWNRPQTVTVTASHDDDAVNDVETLTHTA